MTAMAVIIVVMIVIMVMGMIVRVARVVRMPFVVKTFGALACQMFV